MTLILAIQAFAWLNGLKLRRSSTSKAQVGAPWGPLAIICPPTQQGAIPLRISNSARLCF
jgi:hypothetical protein